jgi:hypothetical protein
MPAVFFAAAIHFAHDRYRLSHGRQYRLGHALSAGRPRRAVVSFILGAACTTVMINYRAETCNSEFAPPLLLEAAPLL